MTLFSLRPLAFVLGAAFVLSACDSGIDNEIGDAADLTEAEVAEATAIVADALAEDGGGLIRAGTRGLRPPCRGDFSLTYNDETGTHVAGYRCGSQNATVTKAFGVLLRYRFRDADGGFVARPHENWASVDSVAFDGERSGFVEKTRGDSLRSRSEFEQTGRWALSQLTTDGLALLQGQQQREGTRVRNGERGQVSKTFSVQLASDGLEIREGEDGLVYAASGEVDYVLTMEVTRGDRTETRTIEGVLVLDGSQRALLRVFGLRNVYRVSLADGETDREA